MATLSIMKYIYAIITYYCYIGTSIIAFDQLVADSSIKDVINVNPAAQQIILALLVIFWIIKIVWFIFDKRLEHRERSLKIESEQDDLDEKRQNRKK